MGSLIKHNFAFTSDGHVTDVIICALSMMLILLQKDS